MQFALPKEKFPELFFGLVAPIGTKLDNVTIQLEEDLKKFGYKVETIRVTELFELFAKVIPPTKPFNTGTKYERYLSYIDYGNFLRAELKDNSILSIAAMYQVSNLRTKSSPGPANANKTAYIIRQFKRPEEIELLRSVYGEKFFQISIYSSRSARVEYLASTFSKDLGEATSDSQKSNAENIVEIDQNEGQNSAGQRIRKTFHDADVIFNGDAEPNKITKQVSRFVKLLFGSNKISPSKDEYGMRLAKSAAFRSIDLSRQVGAAIFDDSGQIISLGSNEVPKALGGTYWSDASNEQDAREFTKGIDSNDERKLELLDEILKILEIEKSEQILKDLSNIQMMDALEYGRVIHAEMCALTDAARKGLTTKNAILYCTTFPCHMCAKHIVASGIIRVVFLEPYPKSLVSRLHDDSVEVENNPRGQYKDYPSVKFEHFHGVTPKRFDKLFYRGKRKNDDGNFVEFQGGEGAPMIDARDLSYLRIESTLVENAVKPILLQIQKTSSE